jgi:hypothetical protein
MLRGETSALEPKVVTTVDINDMVNAVVHHVLINQSGVLVNTLKSLF